MTTRADARGRAPAKRRVAILTFSRIARDRRVLRQCALLDAMGCEPHVVAYATPGDRIDYPLAAWPTPQPTTWHRIRTALRQTPAHLGLEPARLGFWVEPRHRWALKQLRALAPRLVIANDWPALVVAEAYKRESACFVHYDTHEFATLEFDERAWWRFVYRPIVTQLERATIRNADSVSTVGDRLADALQTLYALPTKPAVVRNIPDRIDLPQDTTTAWPLRVLYHGAVLPDRGLEALIDSIPSWATPHQLTIRGDGDSGYIASLRARAAAGRPELVTFEPAVLPDQVMPIAARTADIGVHFTPLDTDQRHFSLPNKLFEYIGAGIAVAVSPGADLRRIVDDFGVGVCSRDPGAPAVADALNALSAESVSGFKGKARQAATVLCWENERERLHQALSPWLED